MKTVNVLPDERAQPGHKTPLHTCRCCFDEVIHEGVTVWHISTTVECECDEEPVKKRLLPQYATDNQCQTSWGASAVGLGRKTLMNSTSDGNQMVWLMSQCNTQHHRGRILNTLEIFHPPLDSLRLFHILHGCVYQHSALKVFTSLSESHSLGLNFPFPVWGVCLMPNTHQTHAPNNEN